MLTADRTARTSTRSGAAPPALRVVICGGGVAAIEAALALRDLATDRVDLTIVSPRRDFILAPLAVGAPFAVAHAPRWPLGEIARELDAQHIVAAVSQVDPDAHRMRLSDDSTLDYDILLLASGARGHPAFDHIHTFAESDPGALNGLLEDHHAVT